MRTDKLMPKIEIPGFAGKQSEGHRRSNKSTKHFEAISNLWNILNVFQIARHFKVDQSARECQACAFSLLHCDNVRSSRALAFAAGTFCVCLCYWPLHCKATCHHLPSQAVLLICLFGFRMALQCQHYFPRQRSRE